MQVGYEHPKNCTFEDGRHINCRLCRLGDDRRLVTCDSSSLAAPQFTAQRTDANVKFSTGSMCCKLHNKCSTCVM